jgi:hypothetical protein
MHGEKDDIKQSSCRLHICHLQAVFNMLYTEYIAITYTASFNFMKISFVRPFLLALIIIAGLAVVGTINKKSYSLSLTRVSVTLSTSRLSFKGALTTGNTALSSVAYINTTQGARPSTSASQLMEGDIVAVGESNSLGSYTVASTSAHNLMYLTTALAAGDADTGDDVISSVSASMTVKFTTANAIANGRFRILVPAEATDGISTDGIPDVNRWDGGFNNVSPNIAATVTCPSDVGATYDFVTGVASRSAVTIGTTEYHSFECAYSGTGAVGTDFDGGNPAGGTDAGVFTINNLINPAPAITHTIGIADTPRIIIQHHNNQFQTVDQTTVAVGLIESVKVTASVAPQITFQIIGVPSGTSGLCDTSSTTVSTTPNVIPLGDLLISSFTTAAQGLSVSTNAANGYAVTVRENDQLGRNGGPGDLCDADPGDSSVLDPRTENASCIPDTLGDGASTVPTGDDMTHTAPAEWSSTTYKGFAYSLEDVNSVAGMSEAFQFNTLGGNCDGTGNCYKQFADAENSEAAEPIFSSIVPADNHNLYICYKAVIGNIQAAGDYENYLTFVATATF